MKLVPFNRRNLIRRNDFDGFYNVLDDFFSDTPLMQRDLRNDTFKLDIEEKDKEYILEADLPGIDKDEIDINLDKGRLTISITREDSEDVEEKNYIHKERRYCSMSRRLTSIPLRSYKRIISDRSLHPRAVTNCLPSTVVSIL